jgi:hypothetical protein
LFQFSLRHERYQPLPVAEVREITLRSTVILEEERNYVSVEGDGCHAAGSVWACPRHSGMARRKSSMDSSCGQKSPRRSRGARGNTARCRAINSSIVGCPSERTCQQVALTLKFSSTHSKASTSSSVELESRVNSRFEKAIQGGSPGRTRTQTIHCNHIACSYPPAWPVSAHDYLAQHGESTAQIAAAVEIMRRMNLKNAIVVSDGYHIFRVKKMLESSGLRFASALGTARWLAREVTVHPASRWLSFVEVAI